MDIDVDHLLDAQRKLVEAELRYLRSRTEYALALKNVHLEKGSLLQYHNMHVFDRQTMQTHGYEGSNTATVDADAVMAVTDDSAEAGVNELTTPQGAANAQQASATGV